MSTDWPDFNDLWDYNQPDETERVFHQILAEGAEDDPDYYLQLKTQIGRTLSLRGLFAEAHTILDEVEVEMAGDDIVEVRYLLERGRTLNSSKKPKEAFPLFMRSFEIAERIGREQGGEADYYAVDALHMLSIASDTNEAQMDWNLKAIAYAEASQQEKAKKWFASLYNNTAWGFFNEKRYEEALDLFQKAQTLREKEGNAHTLGIARWCVAKTLRVMGRVEEGLAIQRSMEAEGKQDGFTMEEIGECLLALGNEEAAQPYFKQAYERLSEIDWVAEDTSRMERLKLLAGL
ncbi:MAG: tetratricopeptide repeat protein [Candidatus Promineifilaceae bacterium]